MDFRVLTACTEDEMLGGLWAQRPGIADWCGAHARATAKAAIFDRMTMIGRRFKNFAPDPWSKVREY